MKNLQLHTIANAQEATDACGANLPRATRKELLKTRISALATSILEMTQRAIDEANAIGAVVEEATPARHTPAKRRTPKTKRRASPVPVTPETEKQRRPSTTPPKVATKRANSGRSPAQRAQTPKSLGKKSQHKHKRGVTPAALGDADGEPLVGPDGVSPLVEGASYAEVVRTFKALESPRDSSGERVTRQLRWAASPGQESPPSNTVSERTLLTDDEFACWLENTAAAGSSSTTRLADARAEGHPLLYDRCVALSTEAASQSTALSHDATMRPLSTEEVTESLRRLAASADEKAGVELDTAEGADGRSDHQAHSRLARERRYYEVIYMLRRDRQSTVSRRASVVLGGAATSEGLDDCEAREVDENEQAQRRMKKLYAKCVFAAAPPQALAPVATPSHLEADAHTTESDAASHAQSQYQVAVMDLLQSSTLEPVRVPLAPLSTFRPFPVATDTASARRPDNDDVLSFTTPPLPPNAQTQPNLSASLALVVHGAPGSGQRTRETSGCDDGQPSLGHSLETSGDAGAVLRLGSGLPAVWTSPADTGSTPPITDEEGSGATVAIRRIETWQRHREDVVASRISNRRRSSVAGLAVPSADFYYTTSSLAASPLADGLLPQKPADVPPAPGPTRRRASSTDGDDDENANEGEEGEAKGDTCRRASTAAVDSESLAPSVSSPSWTTSSGTRAGTLTATSMPDHALPARPHRRSSAAMHSGSSVTTTNAAVSPSLGGAAPWASYDVLLSTTVQGTEASADTAARVTAGDPSAGDAKRMATAAVATSAPVEEGRAAHPAPTPASVLDVIVASDYLTTPHLQHIWQTAQTEPGMSQRGSPDAAALHRGEASATTSRLGSLDNTRADVSIAAATRLSAREASGGFVSPLGVPIVLC